MARALAAVGAALVFLLLVLGVVVYLNRDEDAISARPGRATSRSAPATC